MNTYLPYPDFNKSVEILDSKRLDRQRSDVVAILKACKEPTPDREHPAIHMWRGSEQVLIQYGVAVCLEWKARGNSDTLLPKILAFIGDFPEGNVRPEWLGDIPFHTSHQSYLLRLMPSYYRKYFPSTRDDLPVINPRMEVRISEERLKRDREKLIKKAHKARIQAERAQTVAIKAAVEAGLLPNTLVEASEDELQQWKHFILKSEPEPDDQLTLGVEVAEEALQN